MSHPIRIGGDISIDNEFTRSYISSMKDFHETFVPLPKHTVKYRIYPLTSFGGLKFMVLHSISENTKFKNWRS
jgi:hypothetical protein